MNPYFKLIEDILALIETPQFGAIVNDIRAIEGGAGHHLQTQNAHAALKEALQMANTPLPPARPAVVPGPFDNPSQKA